MTTTRYVTVLVLLLLASTSSAWAEDKKPAATPPGPPRLSKEMEAFMKPLVGTWKCDGKIAAGAFGPGSPEVATRDTVKFRKDYDGFIYRGEVEIKAAQKGIEIPVWMPKRGDIVFGWDPGAKQMLVWHFHSTGAASFATGSPQGDTLIAIGDMGVNMKTRETTIVKNDREHFHKFEIDMGKGWMPLAEGNCTK
jgi:hypothetical protein